MCVRPNPYPHVTGEGMQTMVLTRLPTQRVPAFPCQMVLQSSVSWFFLAYSLSILYSAGFFFFNALWAGNPRPGPLVIPRPSVGHCAEGRCISMSVFPAILYMFLSLAVQKVLTESLIIPQLNCLVCRCRFVVKVEGGWGMLKLCFCCHLSEVK